MWQKALQLSSGGGYQNDPGLYKLVFNRGWNLLFASGYQGSEREYPRDFYCWKIFRARKNLLFQAFRSTNLFCKCGFNA